MDVREACEHLRNQLHKPLVFEGRRVAVEYDRSVCRQLFELWRLDRGPITYKRFLKSLKFTDKGKEVWVSVTRDYTPWLAGGLTAGALGVGAGLAKKYWWDKTLNAGFKSIEQTELQGLDFKSIQHTELQGLSPTIIQDRNSQTFGNTDVSSGKQMSMSLTVVPHTNVIIQVDDSDKWEDFQHKIKTGTGIDPANQRILLNSKPIHTIAELKGWQAHNLGYIRVVDASKKGLN